MAPLADSQDLYHPDKAYRPAAPRLAPTSTITRPQDEEAAEREEE